MDTAWRDLVLAARLLRKTPGFTMAAVLTLAVGIAAATAVFSVVNAALLRPFPYIDADRWANLYEQPAGRLLVASDEPAPNDPNRPIMVSYGLWQRRFAGDPAIVGQQILLNLVPHTVVGVTPRLHVPAEPADRRLRAGIAARDRHGHRA